MWAVDKIANRPTIAPKPEPQPKPPPESKPPVNANAKIADQTALGLASRNKLERLANEILPPAQSQPSPAEILQIARENAPVLVLPREHSFFERLFENSAKPNVSQGNLPADPLEYIAESRLREDVPISLQKPNLNPFSNGFDPNPVTLSDKSLGDNTDGGTDNNFGPEKLAGYADEKTFLDLDNGKRGTLGSADAPVHYQFEPAKDGSPPKLTYHLFYSYNDAPKGSVIPIDFNHEGDWERITYELDPKTLAPVNAELSAHEGGSSFAVNDLQKDAATGRPLIFVANGSHANYANSGDQLIKSEILGANVPTTYDQTSDLNDAVLFDTSRNLREVTSQSWYPTAGSGLRWGEIGESKHSSGPQGPSGNKGAV